MNGITEFLSGINIWLAVVIVDFSIVFMGLLIAMGVKLFSAMVFADRYEYVEAHDYYEGCDERYADESNKASRR